MLPMHVLLLSSFPARMPSAGAVLHAWRAHSCLARLRFLCRCVLYPMCLTTSLGDAWMPLPGAKGLLSGTCRCFYSDYLLPATRMMAQPLPLPSCPIHTCLLALPSAYPLPHATSIPSMAA